MPAGLRALHLLANLINILHERIRKDIGAGLGGCLVIAAHKGGYVAEAVDGCLQPKLVADKEHHIVARGMPAEMGTLGGSLKSSADILPET